MFSRGIPYAFPKGLLARHGSIRHHSTTKLARPVRRSILYMPASQQRNLEKAKKLKADGLILDLEDAVPVQDKETARAMAVEASGNYPDKEVVIRVNMIGTEWFEEDVIAVRNSSANAVLVPKVESADTIERIASLDCGLPVWCMIETPLGVLNAHQIASHPLVDCLVVGTEDLKAELECGDLPDRSPLQFALQQVVLCARANGISAIDGVYTDLKNDEGFQVECQQGIDMGFDGKTLIHPRTIPLANQMFTPDYDEVEKARALLSHFEMSEGKDVGAVSFNGKLVETLHLKRAARVVALAEAMEKDS